MSRAQSLLTFLMSRYQEVLTTDSSCPAMELSLDAARLRCWRSEGTHVQSSYEMDLKLYMSENSGILSQSRPTEVGVVQTLSWMVSSQ